jgi:hypothetical protein
LPTSDQAGLVKLNNKKTTEFGGSVNLSLPKLVKTVRSVPPGGVLSESQADKVHSHKLMCDSLRFFVGFRLN